MEKKKSKSGQGLGVRIVAGVLALLMIVSMFATAIAYIINK